MKVLNKSKIILSFIALCVIILTSYALNGAEVTIVGNAFKPPKNWIDKKGKQRGILVDITKLIAGKMNLTLILNYLTWL